MGIPTLRTCHFETIESIMTKFKSQALHTTKIKYWKTSGSGNPPFLITALQKIAIYVSTKNEILCTFLHTTVLFNVKLLNSRTMPHLVMFIIYKHPQKGWTPCLETGIGNKLFFTVLRLLTLMPIHHCHKPVLLHKWSSLLQAIEKLHQACPPCIKLMQWCR